MAITAVEQKADLANLIKTAQAIGAIRVVHVAGRGQLLEIPDGQEFDYQWIADCGHVSGVYTTIGDALGWKCDVCEELRSLERDVRDLLARLEDRAWSKRQQESKRFDQLIGWVLGPRPEGD